MCSVQAGESKPEAAHCTIPSVQALVEEFRTAQTEDEFCQETSQCSSEKPGDNHVQKAQVSTTSELGSDENKPRKEQTSSAASSSDVMSLKDSRTESEKIIAALPWSVQVDLQDSCTSQNAQLQPWQDGCTMQKLENMSGRDEAMSRNVQRCNKRPLVDAQSPAAAWLEDEDYPVCDEKQKHYHKQKYYRLCNPPRPSGRGRRAATGNKCCQTCKMPFPKGTEKETIRRHMAQHNKE